MKKFYDNIDLVKKIAHKMSKLNNYDDLYQVGLMSLYQSALTYNENIGSFDGYASKRIIYAMKDEIRNSGLFHLPNKLIKIISFINHNAFSMEEIINNLNCTQEDVLKALNFKFISVFDESIYNNKTYFFEDFLDDLTYLEKGVLILKYVHNLTQKDIAVIYELNQTRVSKIIKKALEKIKKDFCN